MGWINVGSAAVGLIGSSLASDAQSDASDAAAAIQREQLEFDKDRYEDWKDVYGDLQEDLGDYYKNLTGETLAGKELEQIQRASQEAQTDISKTLAQRGIDGSGLEADLLANTMHQSELAKANTRATADQRAVDLKQNFLGIGLGQGNAIANSMSNTSTSLANTAISQGANEASAIGTGTQIITNFLQDTNFPKNTNTKKEK